LIDVKRKLIELPPAQPERIKGHWIKISHANIYECSECGKSVMTNDICAYDFCHGCGAKMEVTT
jgi:ribosomal protein L32